MRHRGRDHGWLFIWKAETSAPSLFISRGNRGSSFPLAGCCYSFFTNTAAPPFFSKPREQRSAPPHCHQHHHAVDLLHHLRHGPESRQGKGREVGRGAAARGAAEGAGDLLPSARRAGAEVVLLPLLGDGDECASAHEGTPGRCFGAGSKRVPILRAILLLRALPALLGVLL